MTSQHQQSDGGGGAALFGVIVVIALFVAGVISLAALIDPFSWLPSVKAIWKHCEGNCELAHRFPGFWLHVIANLVYVIVCVVALGVLAVAAGAMRKARAER